MRVRVRELQALTSARQAPYPQTLLLYGPAQGGKSMLIDAVAAESGANVFELGCRNTDGKYEKKKAAMMLHMVFKVAKAMAPSIIKFDEAELTWISDKKKVRREDVTRHTSHVTRHTSHVTGESYGFW